MPHWIPNLQTTCTARSAARTRFLCCQDLEKEEDPLLLDPPSLVKLLDLPNHLLRPAHLPPRDPVHHTYIPSNIPILDPSQRSPRLEHPPHRPQRHIGVTIFEDRDQYPDVDQVKRRRGILSDQVGLENVELCAVQVWGEPFEG